MKKILFFLLLFLPAITSAAQSTSSEPVFDPVADSFLEIPLILEMSGSCGDKYEYYDTGQDDYWNIRSGIWTAQTFTPTETHYISCVNLYLCDYSVSGTPDLVANIYATDSGVPTGDVLATGLIDASTVEDCWTWTWTEIALDSPVQLSASTMYAIELRCDSCDSDHMILWGADFSSPAYSGGTSVYYDGSWTIYSGRDNLFEEWGSESGTGETTSTDLTTEEAFDYSVLIFIGIFLFLLSFLLILR